MGKNDYGVSGIFYALFPGLKIKYCIVLDSYGVFSAKRNFKGFSEERRDIKLNESILLSRGGTVSGRFSIHWAKTFECIKVPHRRQKCLEYENEKICSDCVEKPKVYGLISEMKRACETFLYLLIKKRILCRR